MSLARSAFLFFLVTLSPGILSGCATPAGRPAQPQPRARGMAVPSVVTRPEVMNTAMRHAISMDFLKGRGYRVQDKKVTGADHAALLAVQKSSNRV